MNKPIFYYHVATTNRGDIAIRKSIVDSISRKMDIPFAFFNVKYEELTEKRIINQVNPNASILMIAGSGLYTNYSMSSGWYFPCKTELFEKITVPIILIGLGSNNNIKNDIFGGELKCKAKESIKLINDLAVISTVRDKRTYNILKSLGIRKHELMLDPGNFLESPKIPKQKKVAINIAQHSPALGRFDGNDIIRKKNLNYFTKICKYLISKKYKIIFIAHDALEHSLIIDMKKRVNIEYLNTDNIDTMLKEYAKCEFSIGVKMHSNILSFASGTPFISVYYDYKSIEYLKLIKWDKFGVSIFDDYYTDLLRMVDDMVTNHAHYTKNFHMLKKLEQIKFDKLTRKICNTIKILA